MRWVTVVLMTDRSSQITVLFSHGNAEGAEELLSVVLQPRLQFLRLATTQISLVVYIDTKTGMLIRPHV